MSVREGLRVEIRETYLKGCQLQTIKLATRHPSVGDEEVGEAEIGELLLRVGSVGAKIDIFGSRVRAGQVVPSRDKPVSVEVGLPQDEGAISGRADRDSRGGHCRIGVKWVVGKFLLTNGLPYIQSAKPTWTPRISQHQSAEPTATPMDYSMDNPLFDPMPHF